MNVWFTLLIKQDLNRIKKKPYTETVDSDGRSDEVSKDFIIFFSSPFVIHVYSRLITFLSRKIFPYFTAKFDLLLMS